MDIEVIEQRLRGRWPREGAYAGHLVLPAEASGPLRVAVRTRGGASVGLSAAVVALALVVVAGVALIGGPRNGHGGTLGSQSAEPTIGPDRPAGLRVVEPTVVAAFGTDALTSAVMGPDGAAYLLDSTTHAVYRVDLRTGARIPVVTAGQIAPAPNGKMDVAGNPSLLATGGGDVLILDDSNRLWRWHPAVGDGSGRGVMSELDIPDSVTWGKDVRSIGTFVVDQPLGMYNLYAVDPSVQQVLKYSPAADGTGFPTPGRASYLSVPQDVAAVDDMYIDGDLYLASNGGVEKYKLGQAVAGWSLATPPGGRMAPHYTKLASDSSAPDQGTLYAYDSANQRVVVFSKSDGAYVGQYVADPTGSPWLSSAAGMFVTADAGGAGPTLYWTDGGYLLSASLSAPVAQPSASAAEPSGSFAAPSASDYAAPSTTTSAGHLPTAVSPQWTPDSGWIQYWVLPGDSISAIASKFNLQLWQLELANPQITDFNSLLVGQQILVPPPGQLTQPPATPVPS
jgi:hypothetical protein